MTKNKIKESVNEESQLEESRLEESQLDESQLDESQKENSEIESDTVDNSVDSVVDSEADYDESNNDSDFEDKDNKDSKEDSNTKDDSDQIEDIRVTNLRKIASAKEKLERENEKLAKEYKEALEKLASYEKTVDDEEYDFDDDDSKPEPKLNKEELKKQILEEIRQTNAVENELKRVGDIVNKERQNFAEVVSTVNVSSLKTIDPDEYNRLEREPDLVKKALGAYDAIMKHKLHRLEIKENSKKITENLSKPKHAFVANQKTSSFKNLYTKDAQEVLRRELEESKSRI